MSRIYFFITLLSLLLSTPLFALEVSLRARIEPSTTIKLGESLTYTLECERSGSVQSNPEIRPPDFKGFQVQSTFSSSNVAIVNNLMRIVTQQSYILLPQQTGEFTIGSAEARYYDPSSKKREAVKTEALRILVLPAEGIRDIKGMLSAAKSTWGFLILGLASFSLVAVGAYLFLKKGKTAETVVKPQIVKTLEEEHLEQLDFARIYMGKGNIKEYYIALSDAIRNYLHAKYEVKTKEVTTREILVSVEKAGFSKRTRKALSDFLTECDAVKFAKYTPGIKEMETAYLRGTELIQQTTDIRYKPRK